MLDYKLVEAFAKVIYEGSFDKAAKSLFITQSAISQRVKLLEEQSGQVLLIRTSPPQATLAGTRLLAHYHQVRHLENDLHFGNKRVGKSGFSSLSIGVNADTLETWFFPAVCAYLQERDVVIDIQVDDQEQTHKFLRDGKVLGCISARREAMQGCRVHYIGEVKYSLFCTAKFAGRWFPEGFCWEEVQKAPLLSFNRKDELNHQIFKLVFGKIPSGYPITYIPSAVKYADFILAHIGYGSIPEQQSLPLLTRNRIIDLTPNHNKIIQLYWHCWNLESELLEEFTEVLLKKAGEILRNG
jgi:LysR family transcriptional regulator (chromosome initiation inhibitor)